MGDLQTIDLKGIEATSLRVEQIFRELLKAIRAAAEQGRAEAPAGLSGGEPRTKPLFFPDGIGLIDVGVTAGIDKPGLSVTIKVASKDG